MILYNKVYPKGSLVKGLWVGSTEIKRAYVGGTLVYDLRKTSYFYSPVITLSYANDTAPASGGSLMPTLSYYQEWYHEGYSGRVYWQSDYVNGATVEYSISGAGAVIDSSTGKVTWSNRDVYEGDTREATVTVKVTLNGQSNVATCKVYQEENGYYDDGGTISYGSWNGGAITFSSTANLSVGADSRIVYIAPWKRTYSVSAVIRHYDSGADEEIQAAYGGTDYYTGTVTVSENGTYTSLNASSYSGSSNSKSLTLTKTTCGANETTRVTVTITAKGATTTTGSLVQNANNSYAYSEITSYGTPYISIGEGITCSGGSTTITSYVYNTRTYYYTTGYYCDEEEEYGTVHLSITSNGNSRFSLSGNTLSHSDMTTNGVTDTCIVRATNADDSSKYDTDSVSVSNTYSDSGGITTYGNVTAGSISNKTIPASGGNATATAGNGSQTWSKSAVIRTFCTGDQVTVTAASSGTNTIKPNYSSISGSADSLGTSFANSTTIKSQTVTWSGNGGKSASKTMYIYQEGNYVESIEAQAIKGTHFFYGSNISAIGGSVSPTMNGQATYTFTSGDSLTSSTNNLSGGTVVFKRSYSGTLATGFTEIDSSTGEVTAENRRAIIGNARSQEVTSSLVVTFTHNSTYSTGGTVSSDVLVQKETCTQEGNYVTVVTPGVENINLSGAHFCYPNYISAAGGTVNPTLNGTCTLTFTSGSTKTGTSHTGVSISFSRTYSGTLTTGFTKIDSSTGAVTGADRATTEGAARSQKVTSTLTVTVTHNSTYSAGGTVTGELTQDAWCRQNENYYEDYYTTPIITEYYYSRTSAAGGDKYKTMSYKQEKRRAWDSGDDTLVETITSGAAGYYSKYNTQDAVSLNTGNGTLTWNPNTSASTRSVTIECYIVMNGISSAKYHAESVQNADSIVSYNTPTFDMWWSSGTGNNGTPVSAAGGTSVAPTYSVSQTANYASGQTKSVTPNITSAVFSLNANTTVSTVSVNSSTGVVTFGSAGTSLQNKEHAEILLTLVSHGKTGTDIGWCYQAANIKTNTYGTPSLSLRYTPGEYNNHKDYTAGVSTPTYSFSQSVTSGYSSGKITTSTITSGATWEFSTTASSTVATINSSTGVVTWPINNGTSSRQILVTAKCISNGISNTTQTYLYQDGVVNDKSYYGKVQWTNNSWNSKGTIIDAIYSIGRGLNTDFTSDFSWIFSGTSGSQLITVNDCFEPPVHIIKSGTYRNTSYSANFEPSTFTFTSMDKNNPTIINLIIR